MELFSLPYSAQVNKVIPKNAFDKYTNAKQKKLFAELILRITWIHKLSPDTINLEAKDIKEVQVFKVELKVRQYIQTLLDIIDKAIPYRIIFMVEYGGEVYLSTSPKHPHPMNEDKAVIDWTFKTDWLRPSECIYKLELKKSIDDVYYDFCNQLAGKPCSTNGKLSELVAFADRVDALEKEIAKIRVAIAASKQFNQRVDLNIKLKAKLDALHALMQA
jgi:hypothetical protein